VVVRAAGGSTYLQTSLKLYKIREEKRMARIDEEVGKMVSGKIKWVIIGIILLVVFMIGRSTLITWMIIHPGYVGIKINRLMNKSITKENVFTGFAFYNPIQTVIVSYPAFVQRVAWTQDAKEGNPANEQLTFNTKDSVPVDMDVAVSYQITPDKIPDFYMKFRADNIDTFTHGFFRDATRNVVAQIGSEYTFDEVNGTKKEEFLSRAMKALAANVSPYGVSIQQFGVIGSLRPPKGLADAVSAKTQAIQNAMKVENELRAAEGEARKAVAKAEGEAASNRALTASIDPKLLDWKRLQIQEKMVEKWNGQMPTVMSGNNGMMMTMPMPQGK
jgi:regulator of protease activity HflC (stomatin/prohibitin superfamily)